MSQYSSNYNNAWNVNFNNGNQNNNNKNNYNNVRCVAGFYTNLLRRYMDDCVLVSKNKTYVKMLIPLFKRFLKSELRLRLNPKKLYLQNAANGVEFLGCFIKPTHTVCSGRIKNNFETALSAYSGIARDHKPSGSEKEDFRATVNSYPGILGHYRNYSFRAELLRRYISLVEQVFYSRYSM